MVERRTTCLRSVVVGAICVWLIAGAFGSGRAVAAPALACDEVPTGVDTQDYWLHFKVPPGLMPDSQFDGLPAKLEVHRVSPVYANGKCPSVITRAAVLVHGRTVAGPPVFDLRGSGPNGGKLSVQEALARAGIDTFAPSLLGYGRSTRFDEGLNDPGNASLRPYLSDGSCPHAEGCDRTHIPIFPLDLQGTLLAVNPLAGGRRAHSSNVRFASVDVWVRDIRQVVDDAIARARPTDGKVVLIGYSFGGPRTTSARYAANPVLPGSENVIAKVSRTVFLASLFGGPTEETPPPTGFVTFPMTLTGRTGSNGAWTMAPAREAACSGHVVPGSQDQYWEQSLKLDVLGREWGGNDPARPTGLIRSPTFFNSGWNEAVAGQLTAPTLVMQGLEDMGVPGGAANAPAIYSALPASMTNKVLVQVECASHALPLEGCAGPRCLPASGTPYGGAPGVAWAGPHATLQAALIEWIKRGTFNGAASGRFTVNASGVAIAGP